MRTGYEQAIVSRTTDMHAQTARRKGKVVSINDKGLIIEYEDGTREGFELGRRYGNAGSMTFPHDLKSNLKLGDTVEPGDVLFYDTNYFVPDFLNPKGVALKVGVPVMVALLESNNTFEDSALITQEVADQLTAEVIRIVPVVCNINDELHRVAKVGDYVTSQDPLLIIEDESTVAAGVFDEKTLDTLGELSSDVMRAKYSGRVDHIEVFYNADTEDMSDSVAEIVGANDSRLEYNYRARGEDPLTGEVDEGVRSDGEPILPGTVVIRFYISMRVPMGVGD